MQGEEKAAGSPWLQSSHIRASATVPYWVHFTDFFTASGWDVAQDLGNFARQWDYGQESRLDTVIAKYKTHATVDRYIFGGFGIKQHSVAQIASGLKQHGDKGAQTFV
jgi:hypothetical protein